MDIGDVVNKIYEDGVDFCKGTISKGFLGGCCGYLVAHIQGSDKVLMAQVCAIYFLVDEIFRQCSDQKRSSPFYLLQNCLLGMTWTAVMYNLELISRRSAMVLTSAIGVMTLIGVLIRLAPDKT